MALSHRRLHRRHRPRDGTAVLELIIALPILVLVLVMIVQIGQFFLNLQQLDLAARIGAAEASQTASLPTAGTVPASIVQAIEQQLDNSGIDYCLIRLEHNTAAGGPHILQTTAGGGCTCSPAAPLPAPPMPGDKYVRLSICVKLSEVLPCYAAPLCAAIAPTDTTGSSMVMRYEF